MLLGADGTAQFTAEPLAAWLLGVTALEAEPAAYKRTQPAL
jgi:hypothetical protein